jgi:hypothetical protein
MLTTTRRPRLAALCGAALVLASCAHVEKVEIAKCPVVTTDATDVVDVRYLGVGGVLLSHKTDVILTAPLYSNPSLLEFTLDHQIQSDPETIDRLFPVEGRSARAILVGHSHYDHLMDVPYVALNHALAAHVYGSTTTVNLLASISGKLSPRKLVALDDKAWNPPRQPGEWVKITETMRIMALRSEHSDQFEMDVMGIRMPFHLFRGVQEEPLLTSLPRHPSEWVEGPVFAYLIDFLDDARKPIFRVYYQDSGTNTGIGVPGPAQLAAWGRDRVDLALICEGGEFRRLVSHPETIIRELRPRYALLIHWEDFFATQRAACVDKVFRSPPNVPALVSKLGSTDVQRFRTRIKETDKELYDRTWLPCPTASTLKLPVGSSKVRTSTTTFDCDRFYRYPIPR